MFNCSWSLPDPLPSSETSKDDVCQTIVKKNIPDNQPWTCLLYVRLGAQTDRGNVDIQDQTLRSTLTLTVADQRFADHVLSAVTEDEQSASSGVLYFVLGATTWSF